MGGRSKKYLRRPGQKEKVEIGASHLDDTSRYRRNKSTINAINSYTDVGIGEQDEFLEARNKIDLEDPIFKGRGATRAQSALDSSERGVFKVRGYSSSEDDEDDDEAGNSLQFDDDDDDSEDHAGGATNMSDDDLFDNEQEDVQQEGWGRRKKSYYHTDKDVLAAGDVAARQDEEEEALRLQKLRLQGVDEGDFFDSDDDEDATVDSNLTVPLRERMHQRSKASFASAAGLSDGDDDVDDTTAVEADVIHMDATRRRQLESLPATEKIQILQETAPEILELLAEFKKAQVSTQDNQGQWLRRARAQNLTDPTIHPILSLLDGEYQVSMSYLTNIAFFLALKARGNLSVAKLRQHPVVATLVHLRKLMAKLRAVREAVGPQIAEFEARVVALENGEAAGSESDNDDRPEVMDLDDKSEQEEVKASPVKSKAVAIRSRRVKPSTSRTKTSRRQSVAATAPIAYEPSLADIQRELTGKKPAAAAALKTAALLDQQVKAQLKSALSKRKTTDTDLGDLAYLDEDDHADKSQRRKDIRHHALTSLGEDADDHGTDGNSKSKKRADKRLKLSGDMDLPYKDPNEPHAGSRLNGVPHPMDEQPEPTTAHRSIADNDDDEAFTDVMAGLAGSKDQARRRRAATPGSKKSTSQFSTPHPGEYRLAPGERRLATRQILKNQGLTPKRQSDTRNPRVHRRNQFERAKKKLRNFRKVATVPTSNYGGEATGIRANLTRGVKL
ncbi:something about silencing protein 10 [Tieghemiomyces parasiticus]|uniref:Something about silencing protein 10 n=1 Tax=Tieghemiomyces parasiticus TaxID=78921 RepID=A0A9W7ZVK9_9FUNG|nr:something about silencing protein 10 [Tieghemiomyces parasiticus]